MPIKMEFTLLKVMEFHTLSKEMYFLQNINIEKGDIIVVPRDINRIEALPLVSLGNTDNLRSCNCCASLNAIQR